MVHRLLFLTVLFCLFFTGAGCQSVKVGDKTMSGPEFNQYLVQQESHVRLGASIATRTLLITTVDVGDQVNFKQQAARVAKVVNGLALDGSSDLSEVRVLVSDLISNSKLKNKLLLIELSGTITDLIQQQLVSKYSEAPPESKQAALRALLRGASQGVLDVCGSPPSTQPL